MVSLGFLQLNIVPSFLELGYAFRALRFIKFCYWWRQYTERSVEDTKWRAKKYQSKGTKVIREHLFKSNFSKVLR